jgi:hypothetical protein
MRLNPSHCVGDDVAAGRELRGHETGAAPERYEAGYFATHGVAVAKTAKATRGLRHAVERIGEEEVLLGVAAEQV